MFTGIRLGFEDLRAKIKEHDKGFNIFMLCGIFFWLLFNPWIVIIWALLWMTLVMEPVDVPHYPLEDTINEEYEAMMTERRDHNDDD